MEAGAAQGGDHAREGPILSSDRPGLPSEDLELGRRLGARFGVVSVIDPGSPGTGHQVACLRFLDGLIDVGYPGAIHLTFSTGKTRYYARAFGRGDAPDRAWVGRYRGHTIVAHPAGGGAVTDPARLGRLSLVFEEPVRILTCFPALDAPELGGDVSGFFNDNWLDGVRRMTGAKDPDTLILQPFLWSHHPMQIRRGGDVLVDLDATIAAEGAVPAYRWTPPEDPDDFGAFLRRRWPEGPADVRAGAARALEAARNHGAHLVGVSYGPIGDTIGHASLVRSLGQALNHGTVADGAPVLIALMGDTGGGIGPPTAGWVAEPGICLARLGRVPADVMALFERHAEFFVTEGANTWQEILVLGTPGLSVRPYGQTRPWTHVFGDTRATGQIVAEASGALASPGSRQGAPAHEDLATIAAYIRQARTVGSDLRTYTSRWSQALSDAAGDQVRHALRHLVEDPPT